jgi:hypothetical protein
MTEHPPGGVPQTETPKLLGGVAPSGRQKPRPDVVRTPPGDLRGSRGSPLPQSPVPLGTGEWGASGGTCVRGATGRVIPRRHLEECPGDCEGCLPCGEKHCLTCRRAHVQVTCPDCLGLARENLKAIRELVPYLPGHAVQGRQALHVHNGIPGGDATVMLAPASPGRAPGLIVVVRVEVPNDPRPPLDVLTYWTNIWRAYTENPTTLAPNMGRACDYLGRVLSQVAEDTAFPALAKDLSRVLHQVENVLHAGERPDVSRVPCWDCGTRLQKVWADKEAHDGWRCPTCGEVYDHGRYERAKHDHLASGGADRFVPVSDAVAVTGRPEQSVRTWVRQGHIRSRRGTSGRLEVWWPDVRERHQATPTRRRTP